VMSVEVDEGLWVVPPHRAVWIPAQIDHQIEMTGNVDMRTVYLAPQLSTQLPADCVAIEVSSLLREIILEAVRREMLRCDEPTQAHLIAVLVDQLATLQAAPLRLPLPRHPRLKAVLERLRDVPLETLSIEAVAKQACISVRTLERVMSTETALTFVQWRLRMRMLHALRLLAEDQSVTRVALTVGYQSPSAFIAAFKRELGVTPSEYHRPR
jgi:AraC-like DNA-binding protein